MEATIRLPDFLIIGANKAGTSSLAWYCEQHPGIHMSWPVKEPMFFTSLRPDYTPATAATPGASFTLSEYAALFAGARPDQRCGEASTSYLANPECAAWIQKLIPAVKLVALLRNPIERALSAHRMYRGMGIEDRSFERAVREELAGRSFRVPQGRRYLGAGLYGRQIAAFQARFAREQILVASYETFSRDNRAFLDRLFHFLGVAHFAPAELPRLNAGTDYASDATGVSDLDPALRRDLAGFFADDLERLAALVDFDPRPWLAPAV